MLKKVIIVSMCLLWCAVAARAQGLPHHYIRVGEWVKLVASSDNAVAYQWYLDGQPLTGAIQQQYMTTQPGIYTVEAYSSGGCASERSDPVTIVLINDGTTVYADLAVTKRADAKPVIVNSTFNYYLTALNNGPANATDVVVTDALPKTVKVSTVLPPSSGSASYDAATHIVTWRIPELPVGVSAGLTIEVKATAAGTIENTAGIAGTQTDTVLYNNQAVHRKEILSLHIPNVITPNGDGMNDQLVIDGLSAYEANEMIILNRWGNHVFEQKNYMQNWDGRGLNEGTYFYLLKIKDRSGQWQELKGFITLLRPK